MRATISQDTRAGTLSERFDTQGAGANIGLGQDPLQPTETYIAGLTTGGNPNIKPEIADTTTVGVVYQPDWAESFSLSIDLYDIKIEDTISEFGTPEIRDAATSKGRKRSAP